MRMAAVLLLILVTHANVGFANDLKILQWNIESGGNDPKFIANQLKELARDGGYQIFALKI